MSKKANQNQDQPLPKGWLVKLKGEGEMLFAIESQAIKFANERGLKAPIYQQPK